MSRKSILILIGCALVLAGALYGIAILDQSRTGTVSSTGNNSTDASAPVTIAVFGDNEGTGPILDAIIADVNRRNVDAVVQVGDATSHSEAEEFAAVKEVFARFNAPVYPVPGNNDIIGDKERTQWKDAFGKERWYRVRIKNADMFLLDNADRKVGFPEEERAWLKDELATDRVAHTLMFYHRPFALPLENIFGDDETKASRGTNDAFRALIADKKIDRIYSGHVHGYIPYTLDGIPATVTGGGGALPQDILGGPSAAFFHYLLVTVMDDGVQQELIPITANAEE